MSLLLSEKSLMDEMEVSREYLRLMRKKGLPYYRIGRTIRYNLSDVLNWLENYKYEKA